MGQKTQTKWTKEMKDELSACQASDVRDFADKYGLSFSNCDRKRRKLLEPKSGYQDKAEKYDINKLLAKRSLWEAIGESFVGAIRAIPDPKHPQLKMSSEGYDEEEMFSIFSDSQIGAFVSSKETGGLGDYSAKEFDARLSFYQEKLGRIFQIERSVVPYNRINLFFLGDIIEGSTIFKSQGRSIDMTTVAQIMKSVDAITNLVSWLSTLFCEVGCYCVVGNHGRIGDKGQNSPMDNLDYLVYKWAEERLSLHSNVSINISESWWMVVERMNTRFCLVHGDDVRSWMNIPFYGADRSEMRMQKLLKVMFNYYVIGHHHTPAEFSNVIMNGNWVGGSELSLKVMQVGGLPSQKLFSVHPDYGITWHRDILLVDPRKLKPTRIYT